MADKKEHITNEKNASTEEKIKEAAKRVFTSKGYAATRTRDIAEESGYNLALINYYFRSKEKLFDIVMMEQLQVFVHSVSGMLDDHNTTLQQKITTLVEYYIDMLKENAGLPFFIMNEVNQNPQKLLTKIRMEKQDLYFIKQWEEMAAGNNKMTVNPIHVFMNLLAMTVFPFVARPMMSIKIGLTQEQFNMLMDERKQLIPMWIAGMMK